MEFQIFLFFIICATFVSSKSVYKPVPIHDLNAVEQIISEQGYPSETYNVTTEDGYILTVHRIPYSPTKGAPTKGVVFVQHGLLCSSADWVVMGKEKGLAFILSDEGYDVWLGNARGNTLSKRHLTLDPKKDAKKFWAFSWNEIGMYDLPAMIDFALATTGESKLSYVGHSQGTTSFFVMASERPEYNQKIKSMHALAPVAFMSHMASPLMRILAPFVNNIEFLTNLIGLHEFLPSSEFLGNVANEVCKDGQWTQEICSGVLFLLCGFNEEQLNSTALPAILQNTPAGASTRQLLHYGQEATSAKFRKFDFGLFGNLKIYKQNHPPDYDLKKVTAPVALHYSDNDWMANPKDVALLHDKLGNSLGKFKVQDPKWNHLDFTWGIDADRLLFPKVISLMNRFA